MRGKVQSKSSNISHSHDDLISCLDAFVGLWTQRTWVMMAVL